MAYLHALCAQACCDLSEPKMDIHKIDWAIQHQDAFMPVGIQLKSVLVDPNTLPRVKIDKATHDVLRRKDAFNRFLFVLALPKDGKWVCPTLDALLVRTCMYWHDLRGESALTAATKTYTAIPGQVVTPDWLCGVFRGIDQEMGEE